MAPSLGLKAQRGIAAAKARNRGAAQRNKDFVVQRGFAAN
jgi:hypothetical protein